MSFAVGSLALLTWESGQIRRGVENSVALQKRRCLLFARGVGVLRNDPTFGAVAVAQPLAEAGALAVDIVPTGLKRGVKVAGRHRYWNGNIDWSCGTIQSDELGVGKRSWRCSDEGEEGGDAGNDCVSEMHIEVREIARRVFWKCGEEMIC